MDHIFWVVPNLLAGRCGPDEQPWRLKHLRRAGFGAVLSVDDGERCRPEDFAAQGLAYACISTFKECTATRWRSRILS